ncbi:high-affinity Zn(2+) transporter zrt1 [Phlyctochytrium planicorne]|nr:high-affinity Zn(2+) transporter zrt1 [Phlyctochytrium planicorne]
MMALVIQAVPQQPTSALISAIPSITSSVGIPVPTPDSNSTTLSTPDDVKDKPDSDADADDQDKQDADAVEEDACALALDGDYDQNLHITALFIIMGVSLLGVIIPVGATKLHSGANINNLFFQCAKLFGAGVILCTAFIHMLSPAIELLTNPCLPTFFTETYTSLASAIALFGALSTHLIQLLASRAIAANMGPSHTPFAGDAQAAGHRHHGGEAAPYLLSSSDAATAATPAAATPDDKDIRKRGGSAHEMQIRSDSVTASIDQASSIEDGTKIPSKTMAELHTGASSDDHGHHLILLEEKRVTTYILELGIATHSVIIGLALGVTRGAEVKSLFAALVFHQFFEGVALSTVVLETKFKRAAITWAMVMFYVLTTPVGILAGILLNSTYNSNARSNLLSQGILEALSAGILAYDALVNIIYLHFQSAAVKKMKGLICPPDFDCNVTNCTPRTQPKSPLAYVAAAIVAIVAVGSLIYCFHLSTKRKRGLENLARSTDPTSAAVIRHNVEEYELRARGRLERVLNAEVPPKPPAYGDVGSGGTLLRPLAPLTIAGEGRDGEENALPAYVAAGGVGDAAGEIGGEIGLGEGDVEEGVVVDRVRVDVEIVEGAGNGEQEQLVEGGMDEQQPNPSNDDAAAQGSVTNAATQEDSEFITSRDPSPSPDS